MRTPLMLLLLSLASAGGILMTEGATLTLPLAVASLSAVAALLILGVALLRGFGADAPDGRRPIPGRRSRKGPHVVIDGSNVMHWNGETPHLDTLREVVTTLRGRGFQPGVVFDANAGYKFSDRYLDDRHFAKLLNLPSDWVLVVGKGEPADPTILAAARDLGAKVLTNDRYREWTADFPEVATPGHLVRGGYRDGRLWLDETALAASLSTR